MIFLEEAYLDELPEGAVFAAGRELYRKVGGWSESLSDGKLMLDAKSFRVNGVLHRVRSRVFVISGGSNVQSR